MGEDHDEAGLQDHVLSHVLVLAGHHHHGLLAGDALGHVVLVVAAVHLARLQRGQALGPVALVRVLDQVADDGERAAAVDEGAFDDGLEHGVRRGDHPAPARHAGRLKGVHPPGERGDPPLYGQRTSGYMHTNTNKAVLPLIILMGLRSKSDQI